VIRTSQSPRHKGAGFGPPPLRPPLGAHVLWPALPHCSPTSVPPPLPPPPPPGQPCPPPPVPHLLQATMNHRPLTFCAGERGRAWCSRKHKGAPAYGRPKRTVPPGPLKPNNVGVVFRAPFALELRNPSGPLPLCQSTVVSPLPSPPPPPPFLLCPPPSNPCTCTPCCVFIPCSPVIGGCHPLPAVTPEAEIRPALVCAPPPWDAEFPFAFPGPRWPA